MNFKLIVIFFLIAPFLNLNAQYKFAEGVSVSHEMTVAQLSAFKKVLDTDKDVMMKNNVKKITFRNSRGKVEYLYNKQGLLTQFSIIDSDNNGVLEEYFYDGQNRITKFIFSSVQQGVKEGTEYFYRYDAKGRLSETGTTSEIFMSDAKLLRINYANTALPDAPASIDYYKESSSPLLYSAEIICDEQGRVTLIKDRKGLDDIIITYKEDGIDAAYHLDLISHYTINKNNQITNFNDDFVSSEFTYKPNGLIDTLTLTAKEDNKKAIYVFEYEFY